MAQLRMSTPRCRRNEWRKWRSRRVDRRRRSASMSMSASTSAPRARQSRRWRNLGSGGTVVGGTGPRRHRSRGNERRSRREPAAQLGRPLQPQRSVGQGTRPLQAPLRRSPGQPSRAMTTISSRSARPSAAGDGASTCAGGRLTRAVCVLQTASEVRGLASRPSLAPRDQSQPLLHQVEIAIVVQQRHAVLDAPGGDDDVDRTAHCYSGASQARGSLRRRSARCRGRRV